MEEKLEVRIMIEKAKGIITRANSFTEEESYNYIRKLSMDKRCSIKDIAKMIIYSENLSD